MVERVVVALAVVEIDGVPMVRCEQGEAFLDTYVPDACLARAVLTGLVQSWPALPPMVIGGHVSRRRARMVEPVAQPAQDTSGEEGWRNERGLRTK